MARTLKIGILVATALAILVVTIFSLSAEQRFWERRVQYEIHFTRTGGLQTGAQMSLNGVPVGSVVDMRFPPDPAVNYIQVLANVRSDVAPRIREDTWASIRTIGLLGDRYIELSAGSPAAAAIPPGGLIPSVDPIDIEALVGRGGDIVTNIVEVTASLKDVLQTLQRGEGLLGVMLRNRELGEATLVDLRHTMANVEGTTRSLDQIVQRMNRGEGMLGQLIGDTPEARELAAHIRRAAKSVDQFTGRLNHGKGAFVQLVEDEAYARRLLANLDRSIADLAAVADKLNRGQGTLGKLVNDPSLYREAKSLTGRLRGNWFLRLFGAGGAPAPTEGAPDTAPPSEAPRAPSGGRAR